MVGAVALLIALISGCGDDDVVRGDAALDAAPDSDDARDGSGASEPMLPGVAPPMPPADPMPPTLPAEAMPAAISRSCPSGDFPDIVPAGEILYVRPGATGAGTRADPFGTIAAALAVAATGTTIALAKGEYRESISIPSDVAIEGACADETTLTGEGASESVRGGARTALRHVTIDTSVHGIVADTGASLTVEDVVVRRAAGHALRVGTGGSLIARRVAVRRVDRAEDRADGVRVERGVLELEDVVIEGFTYGIAIEGSSMVHLADVVVRGTVPPPIDGIIGVLSEGAVLDAERLVVERLQQGVLVLGGRADLRDVFIRDGMPDSRALGVRADAIVTVERASLADQLLGIYAESELDVADLSCQRVGTAVDVTSGHTVLARAHVTDARTVAVAARGGSVVASDLSIERVVADADGARGWGIQASNGRSTFERARMEHTHEAGVVVVNARTDLRDVTIVDVESAGEFRLGRGISLQEGAVGTLERAVVRQTHEAAIALLRDSELVASDVTIEDSLSRDRFPPGGMAISVRGGSHAELTRVSTLRSVIAGLIVQDEGSDAVVRDARFDSIREGMVGIGDGMTDVSPGVGMRVHHAAAIDAERVVVERASGIGLLTVDAQSRMQARDIAVIDTTMVPCDERPGCVSDFGVGLAAAAGSTLDVTGFVVDRAVLCGAYTAQRGSLAIREGWIVRCAIGFCAERAADIESGVRDVELRMVETAVDARTLPLPSIEL